MSASLPSIGELEETATAIDAQHYELRLWRNGTYLVRAPSGEATEVPEEAVAGALAQLFRTFF